MVRRFGPGAFFLATSVILAITLLVALSRPAFRGFAAPAPAPGIQPPERALVEAATRR